MINELVYFPEVGVIDTPMIPRQFHLAPDAGKAIKILNDLGMKTVVTSNQPGIAQGKMTVENFRKIRSKMISELKKQSARIDAEYYCFHHPLAVRRKYRQNCECRKPKAGLLLKAAKDLDLNLRDSFMIGDSLVDVETGKRAGCTTFLIGSTKGDLIRLMEERNIHPDAVLPDFLAVAKEIERRTM